MRQVMVAICLAGLWKPAPAGEWNRLSVSPIIGLWEWRMPDGCIERHEFLTTGRMLGSSVAERVEEAFEISSYPDGKGFFRLSGRTLKDTGGPDCSGSKDNHSGKKWAVYVRFSPDKEEHFVCVEPRVTTCWGPYRRIRNPQDGAAAR